MSGSVWTNPNAPNLPDYTLFVTDYMQLSVYVIPANSVWLGYALNQAMNLCIRHPMCWVFGTDYTLAVYNCAAHIQLRITPDQPGRLELEKLRDRFHLNSPNFGVIGSMSDQGTSETKVISEALGNLTLGDLNFTLTPYGREYLAYAQDFGSGAFGLS